MTKGSAGTHLEPPRPAILLGATLLFENDGRGHDGALGIAKDALRLLVCVAKSSSGSQGTNVNLRILVNLRQNPVEGIVHRLRGKRARLVNQGAHRVLGRLAGGHVANVGEHVVEGRHAVVLDEAVQWRGAEEVAELVGRGGRVSARDPFEVDGAGLFDGRGEWLQLDLEFLGGSAMGLYAACLGYTVRLRFRTRRGGRGWS